MRAQPWLPSCYAHVPHAHAQACLHVYVVSRAGGGSALLVTAAGTTTTGGGGMDMAASSALAERVVAGLKPCLMRHTRDPALAAQAAHLLAGLTASPTCPPT